MCCQKLPVSVHQLPLFRNDEEDRAVKLVPWGLFSACTIFHEVDLSAFMTTMTSWTEPIREAAWRSERRVMPSRGDYAGGSPTDL